MSLSQLKRQAKELLRAFRSGDTNAIQTVTTHFPGADPTHFRLAQAQLVLARSLGHPSWSRLREAVGATSTSRRKRTKPAEMAGRYVYDVVPVDGDLAWEFFEACRDGDLDAVRRLLTSDSNLVHAQYWYTQPTHFAVYANQPSILRTLLDAGAEPGRSEAWPFLMRRAQAMRYETVHKILVSVACERFGFNPCFSQLQGAIISRDIDKITKVLNDAPELAQGSDASGSNAIHWAVMTRQPDLFALLRNHGADPNHKRSDGQTPAQLVFNGDYEFRVWRELKGVPHADQRTTIEALLDAGASIDLSVACATGNLAHVKQLLADDAQRAKQLDTGRRNPLMYASRAGHIDIVRFLLEHGADPSQPEDWAPHGWSLWMACSRGDVDMVALLLEHGANPNSAPDSSDSCLGITLHNASASGRRRATNRTHVACKRC